MSEDKLEFKITKDAVGNDIEFDNLSVEATNSLISILESMREILINTEGAEDLKIQLVKGSIGVQVPGPENVIQQFQNDFQNILDKKETNSDIVAPWRQLQNLFRANGLTYEANFYTKANKVPVISKIKKATEFRAKPVRRYAKFDLEFLKGKLIEVGGKNPNIHLLSGDIKIPIRCTENEAILVNRYLYQEIEIVTWKKSFNDINEYTFCDFYTKAEHLAFFKDIIASLKNETLEKFLFDLHFIIKDLLEKDDFVTFKKFFKLFDHVGTDPNIIKTILVISKSFADHVEIKEQRAKLYHTLKSKIDAGTN